MFDQFLEGYIEAALFSSCDVDDTPVDSKFSVTDLAPETVESFKADCRKFYDENFDLISDNLTDAGRDFWFTRCHHGAGFWDGDWPEHGDALTEASHRFGEIGLIIGEDGLIYSC